jgi:hypothetical protein
MRDEAQILTVILNAKAFFTKEVQNIATILETRLLNEGEQLAEKELQSLSIAIQSIENGYLTLAQKNTMADYIMQQSWYIDLLLGQSYVENNYTVGNDYVVFSQ